MSIRSVSGTPSTRAVPVTVTPGPGAAAETGVVAAAADRALGQLGRNQVFAVRGPVDDLTVLLVGTLTNRRGQVVASCPVTVTFPVPDNPGFALVTPHATAAEMVEQAGLRSVLSNPGPVPVTGLQRFVRHAVEEAEKAMDPVFTAAADNAARRVEQWSSRVDLWETAVAGVAQRSEIRQRRLSVEEERRLARQMAPDRRLIRPLVLVLPTAEEV